MAKIYTTLLDLDRAPTLGELKEFFRKHDWSAAEIPINANKNSETLKKYRISKKYLTKNLKKQPKKKDCVSNQFIMRIK